ncbi:protein mono-ADP-ribosyltransferase PARP12 isoform X3 [Eptesicus fuscus]|uniref:protein mono-ADP-ribosyltransferase PARP12 isoform X3 n=1 Tax=Eptesicus fuscus TaxID=29078 RepID=UPI002403FBC0|nr:protein mono-ADP-ribosyltransferase PARP12 isoform X3 [Eptesicus fuscus]
MAQAAALAEVTQVLCAAGGALELGELRRRLRDGVGADALERLLRESRRFVVVTRPDAGGAAAVPERVVLAVSALRLCRGHQGLKPTCAGLCGQLHLCKFMVLGACKFLRTGKNCRNSHTLTTEHNLSVLKTHGVDHLSYSELCQLLFQNDPWLLPEICLHYNKGDGHHGSCSFRKQCVKLHVCQYFVQGECKFGTGCKRSHDFSNSENVEKLQKLGMSSDLVSRMPSIYRNAHDIKNKSSAPVPQATSERRDSSGSVSSTTTNQEESDQICLYHIRKSCSFQDKCNRVHFHLPYRWQFLDGGKWKDLDKMELIEEAYSNPNKNRVLCADLVSIFHSDYLNFESMRFGSARVRRLSTASSVTKPPHFILTTEWIWYWTDDFGCWQEYGKQGMEHPTTTVSSSDLEKAYLAYCAPGSDTQAAILKFQAGKHKYELDFRAMSSFKAQRASQTIGTPQPCRTPALSGSPSVLSQKNIRRFAICLTIHCLTTMFRRSSESRTWLSGKSTSGKKGRCRREMEGKRWMRGSCSMVLALVWLMQFASRILIGGSVVFMALPMAKGATLPEMLHIPTTTANPIQTATQCSWLGCWWASSPEVMPP